MVDTIIKGTGNSRTLKTIPNAAALYPDFDAFLAAMVAGTLPIDIGPLNPTGVQVQGTEREPVDRRHGGGNGTDRRGDAE